MILQLNLVPSLKALWTTASIKCSACKFKMYQSPCCSLWIPHCLSGIHSVYHICIWYKHNPIVFICFLSQSTGRAGKQIGCFEIDINVTAQSKPWSKSFYLISAIHVLILNCYSNSITLCQVSIITLTIYNILARRRELPLQLCFSWPEIESITV